MSTMYYLTYVPTLPSVNPTIPLLTLDREKVVSPPAAKVDTSKHHHVFVGDLSPEIDADTLRASFARFGEISECKIIRDPQTLKPKGYGFVTFVEKQDAENAIASMNGQWLGNRAIRTNWASRKPPQPIKEGQRPAFDEVYNQSSATNCTVYCGGIMKNLTEELAHNVFSLFGKIEEVRVFKEKGYCFVRYNNKEAATRAIIEVNGTDVGGQVVKCAWGKESSDNPGVQLSSSLPLGLQYLQNLQNIQTLQNLYYPAAPNSMAAPAPLAPPPTGLASLQHNPSSPPCSMAAVGMATPSAQPATLLQQAALAQTHPYQNLALNAGWNHMLLGSNGGHQLSTAAASNAPSVASLLNTYQHLHSQ